MSSKKIEYDLVVKNRHDLEDVVNQFEKFAKKINDNPLVFEISKNKKIRIFIQDCFAPIKVGSVVKHFKGRSYYIQDKVINSEDSKPMFVYQALYSPYEKFVRYESEFYDIVNFERYHNARQCYRFVAIAPDRLSR